ncbi:MAG: transcriptional repressor LexA [Acidobacteriota bacterium]
MALTRRQREIYDFIRRFIEEKGYAPSLEEIGRAFGLRSAATVHKHVTNLVRKGMIRRTWNQNRSIDLVVEGRAPRAVDAPLAGQVIAGRVVAYEAPHEVMAIPPWLTRGGRTALYAVAGDDLEHERIVDGDLLVVDEGRDARAEGLVFVALDDGPLTLRRLRRRDRLVHVAGLRPGDPEMVVSDSRAAVRGVVLGMIRRC